MSMHRFEFVRVSLAVLMSFGALRLSASGVHSMPDISTDFYSLDFAALEGESTPFSEVVGNLVVTYASPPAEAFGVQRLNGVSALVGMPGSHTLEIQLSERMYGFTLDFLALGSGRFQVETFDGIVSKGVDSLDHGGDLETQLTRIPVCVCPNYFDRLVLSETSDQPFAIKRIGLVHYTPDSGSSLGLFSLGIIALLFTRNRLGRN